MSEKERGCCSMQCSNGSPFLFICLFNSCFFFLSFSQVFSLCAGCGVARIKIAKNACSQDPTDAACEMEKQKGKKGDWKKRSRGRSGKKVMKKSQTKVRRRRD
ncbi:uncharacterized protein BDW47DRAFT_114289 [Aspergillus candidus]|uniref:Uncharacterized protein n=1 Tax=Aspergillus candidus TaxID=41067 RepID=A0A2I2EY25_ASPCN|nr:hypothetical protein BDW47DRAFT_114289 [Aspergillus candidus]PLB33286.1 hypothetical protein BDW47DRAFT_114289 [Aspergillus candidus]